MASLKRAPGDAARCRANVPVPGHVHTVRCRSFALWRGLCTQHYLLDRAQQHAVDCRRA